MILRALDVAGGTVVVPTNMFGASAVAVLRAGGTPGLRDAAEGLSISVEAVERRLSANVRAVMTVHIGGAISPVLAELAELCSAWGIPLVEDAAHAAGAAHDGLAAGRWGVGRGVLPVQHEGRHERRGRADRDR